jgi:hypothetical protein
MKLESQIMIGEYTYTPWNIADSLGTYAEVDGIYRAIVGVVTEDEDGDAQFTHYVSAAPSAARGAAGMSP